MASTVQEALYESVLYRIKRARDEDEVEAALQWATARSLAGKWPQELNDRIKLEAAEKRRGWADA